LISTVWPRRGLHVGQVRRLWCDQRRRQARVLGPHLTHVLLPEDRIARLHIGDPASDFLDVAREVQAHAPLLGPEQPRDEANRGRCALHDVAVGAVQRRRADSQEHLVVAGDRAVDLFEFQDVGWAVGVADDCFHTWIPVEG